MIHSLPEIAHPDRVEDPPGVGYARRMKRFVISLGVVLTLAACGGGSSDEPLAQAGDGCDGRSTPEERFTCRMARLARQGLPGATVDEVGPLSLEVTPEAGGGLRSNLDNLWADCRVDPAMCATNAQRVVSSVREALASADTPLDRATVRAQIKPAAWVGGMSAALRERGATDEEIRAHQPLSRPFQPGLSVVYVEDRPDSMRILGASDLEALGVDLDALHLLALANLRDACRDFRHEPVASGSRVMTLTAGDSYESSRLLLPELWQPIADEVEGELVVSAPSRDRVFFTGDARSEDLAELRRLAREHATTDGHPLVADLLRRTADGWVVVSAP